jgi:MYND finger
VEQERQDGGKTKVLDQIRGAIIDLIRQCPNEVRVLEKRAEVVYAHRDNPSEELKATFTHNYANECASCHKWRTTAHKVSKCSRCLTTYYCSATCQRADWPSHKQVCKH